MLDDGFAILGKRERERERERSEIIGIIGLILKCMRKHGSFAQAEVRESA